MQKLVNLRNPEPNEEDFLQLGKSIYIPKDWYSRIDIFYDTALEQLADNLAFSEKKFIFEEIIKADNSRHIELPKIDANVLVDQFEKILDTTNIHPTLLFAPVDYFVKINVDWNTTNNSFRVDAFNKVIISGHPLDVFWSNKYMPFTNFVIIDKSFGEWVSKPSINDRLYVKISESDKPDKMDLVMYTIFKFKITKPEKITILSPSPDSNENK